MIVRELAIKLLVSVGPNVIRAAYGDAGQVQFRWNSKGLVEQGKSPVFFITHSARKVFTVRAALQTIVVYVSRLDLSVALL